MCRAGQTVSEWLRASGQSANLCRWLWNPLAIAALNQSPDTAAAAPFVRVIAELFGSDPTAASIGLASVPLDDLFAAPSAAFIGARGGQVAGRLRARLSVTESGEFLVRAGETEIASPVVISAVPWHAFSRLWEGEVPAALPDVEAAASAMAGSPIVTVNMWLDSPEPGRRSGSARVCRVRRRTDALVVQQRRPGQRGPAPVDCRERRR